MNGTEVIFDAIQLDSVRRSDIVNALGERGVDWRSACHVTATSSLAEVMWRSGDVALSIAALLDLIVVSSRLRDGAGSITSYPIASKLQDLSEYRSSVRDWSAAIEGNRVRLALQIDDTLRRFARADGGAEAQLLVRERREFQRAMHTLIAAGLSPDCDEFQPGTPIGQSARKAWRSIEQVHPEVRYLREDLWSLDPNDLAPSAETATRSRAALSRVFGQRPRWTILHHGFYFYTPPQWALFRFFRELGIADQYFIVHDDGSMPMFEIWRRFFSSRWSMPEPRRERDRAIRPVTPPAAALRAAWSGHGISQDDVGDALRLIEYRSPAQFVRSTMHHAVDASTGDEEKPTIFGAQHADIERFCERLGPLADGGRSVLAQLPVGAFLLRLHECIQGSDAGATQLVLTADGVRDIATSGFLALPEGTPSISSLRSAWSRATPFFRDCRFLSEWVVRSQSLERLIIDTVGRLGHRDASHDDVERLAVAAGNPMRLAPWADLSVAEANAIRIVIESIAGALETIAKAERVSFVEHARFIADHVRRGINAVTPEQARGIEARMHGFSIGLEGDVDVMGLIDVVSLLLGRDAVDDGGEPSASGPRHHGTIRPLRALDALGYAPSNSPLHLANLADGAFPSVVPAIGWPFRREDIVDPLHIGRGLLETRSDHAALGDLYLLWLALDGVEPGVPITLSWISEIGGDPRSPSSVLSLLSRPTERGLDAVAERIGGLTVVPPRSSGSGVARSTAAAVPDSRASDVDMAAALERIPTKVAAMAFACPRWLTTHWLFGPTMAHTAEFQYALLYGNLIGALQKANGMSATDATACADGLWRFVDQGERGSSVQHAVVLPDRGAMAEWVLTLDGSRPRGERGDPVSRAYLSAAGAGSPVSLSVLQQFGAGFLPPPAKERRGEICTFCPAQSRCLMARRPRDETD